jgi:hypothetical protein
MAKNLFVSRFWNLFYCVVSSNVKKIIKPKLMPASQSQIDKVNAANSVLYSDPDFATVTDISVSLTQTPPVPAPEVDVVDVVKPTPTV